MVKPGYKQTEVGVLPVSWEVALIESLLAVSIQNGVFNEPSRKGRGLKLINVIDLYGKFPINTNELERFDANNDEILRFRVKNGDIFFTRSSLTPEGIAKCNIYQKDGDEEILYDCHIIRVRVNDSKADPFYLARYCGSCAARSFLVANAKTTTMTTIDQSVISRLPVAIPPLGEQQAIASALSDADELIGSLEQLLTKKRQIKQGAMQELLTGKKRLPGFSGEWEVKTLGDIVEKIVGGGTPSRTNPSFWGGTIPWVTVKDFATFNPCCSQETITEAGLRGSSSNLIPAKTLITSTRMALGKAVIYEVDVAINQDLKALFLTKDFNRTFVYYWFELSARLIDDLGGGSTVKGISLSELKKIPFPVLSLSEQSAIAEVLSDMDAEIEALETKLTKAKQVKQGMMQELLTGRIRLV